MDLLLLILLALSTGALAIQTAYASSIVQRFKRVLGLSLPYKYNSLCSFNSWQKIVGNKTAFYCLLPFFTVFIIAAWVHRTIAELLGCSFCSAFWLMLLFNIIVMGLPILTAIVLAPLALVAVAAIEKLMT